MTSPVVMAPVLKFRPFFARHLLSIGCWDETPAVLEVNGGNRALYAFSGFVVSINGASWSLMTAGHPIREPEEYIKRGRTFTDWHIDDSPGQIPPGGVPVPFTWEPELIAVLHDDSRWLIPLSSNQQALLASNGVAPITELEVADIFVEDFERWCLLGLPGENARQDHVRQVVEKHTLDRYQQPVAPGTLARVAARSDARGRDSRPSCSSSSQLPLKGESMRKTNIKHDANPAT
jgi:hypothetical protein